MGSKIWRVHQEAIRAAQYSSAAAFLRNTRGSTSSEYALIAGLISVLIVFGVTNIGDSLLSFFTGAAAALD